MLPPRMWEHLAGEVLLCCKWRRKAQAEEARNKEVYTPQSCTRHMREWRPYRRWRSWSRQASVLLASRLHVQAQACCLVRPSARRMLSSFTALWPNTCVSFPVLMSFRLGRSGYGIVFPKSLKPACVRPIPCCTTCVSVATLVRAHQSSVAAELSTGGKPCDFSLLPTRKALHPAFTGRLRGYCSLLEQNICCWLSLHC